MTMDTMLASALRYASSGWDVLPCIPTGNKNKAPLLTRGFKDASSNPAVVTSWWGSFPDALIGLAVPVGVVVLDIDHREGGTVEQLEALAVALQATSGWAIKPGQEECS